MTTLVSVGALLYGATGLFRHLKDSLNVVWSVPPATPDKVKGFLKDTALSLLMVMGFGVLLLVVLLANTVLFQFVRSQGGAQVFPFGQVLGFALLLVFTVLTFATIYKVLPDAHVDWHDVWMGAAVTAVLFTLGQAVIGFVLNQSTLDTLYGTASALVFILIWVHISAHIVLFGAEFTQVYANHYGSKIVPTSADNPKRAEQT